MSYELFFYKKKDSQVTEQTIRTYLRENLTKPNEQNNQWWFENEDTCVYFSFETTDKDDFDVSMLLSPFFIEILTIYGVYLYPMPRTE